MPRIARALGALLAAATLSACQSGIAAQPRTVHAQRIVSLMPSLTADLCAIGAGKQLVGVSAYSEDIPCAKGVPIVGDFASVDAEQVVKLHPDVAVGIPAQRRLTAPLTRAGIGTAFFRDDTYDDIFTGIEGLGALSGHTVQARKLTAELKEETDHLQASERFKRSPRVFVVLGTGPIWTVGPQSYISTLIRLAGGRNAVTKLPSAYAQYSGEALLALQPDALVSDKATNLPSALSREPWRSLRAVQQGRVFIVDPASMLERPGPRYNEGLRWLIERLRPIAQ